MAPDERSAYLLAEARRHDPDRYLCALFAPADAREHLLALTLFNHELARIPEMVTQPMAGMIRLQWWRDALDEIAAGRPPRQHPVVEAVAQLLATGRVSPNALYALIDAREPALEAPVPALDWLERYAAGTGGELARVWYGALGGSSPLEADAAGTIGTAYTLAGLDRALRLETLLGQDAAGMARLRTLGAEMRRRAAELSADGRRQAGRPARALMAAFLLAVLVPGRGPLAPLAMAARVWLRRP